MTRGLAIGKGGRGRSRRVRRLANHVDFDRVEKKFADVLRR